MVILSKEELVKGTRNPKVFPTIAKKVLDMVNSDNSSIVELCTTIEKDQAFTAAILKIANSAFYGLRQEVTNIKQATVVLGFNTLKNLVITVSTKLQYKRLGITEQMMWDHSVGAAIAARFISSGHEKELEEIAFICGLMHDFGKIVINNECPDAFLEVMQEIYNENQDSIVAEEKVFGYNHTEIGSVVTAQWGFPPVLSNVMEYHHLNKCKPENIEDSFIAKAIACIHLADNICKLLGIGYRNPDETILPHELPSATFLEVNQDRMDRLIKEIGEAYEKEKSVFR
jgi:HD-like signal output (HDOD) protein